MSKKNDSGKISIWNELNGASIGVGISLLILVIASIGLYIFMNLSPSKTVKVQDDAQIFSDVEEETIKVLARELSSEKDISVVVITTRDKGSRYTNSDDDCRRFAEDYYMSNVKTVPLQNNSGICILVDLTIDEAGQRFFWLYTYGTAHFAVDDDDCQNLFYRYKEYLGNAQYGYAIGKILNDLHRYSYRGYGAIILITMFFPLVIALVVTLLSGPSRKLDPAPKTSHYSTIPVSLINKKDTFVKKVVTRMESSSGGGGGGGGFSGGGGGGGGFSGGGGGRF